MKTLNKQFLSPFLFAFLYGVFFYILQFFFAQTGIFKITPSATNLHSWDVGFYDSIAHQGYNYESNNTGFFILFPLIWKISNLGIWGISFLNIAFFSLGFAILMVTMKAYDRVFWLLCLTIPSVYFAFLPYTESLFFLLGATVMYAIKEKKLWLIWVSLCLISLVRATAVFFLPALFLTELFSNPLNEWLKSCGRFVYKYALPSLLGLGIFILWQYHETGIWFAYFKTQSIHWEHSFSLPEIPFSNIEDATVRYHWLSALALFIDMLAIFILFKQFLIWLKNKNVIEGNLILSLGYLAMTLIFIITFNPKYGNNKSNIMGANRYTFITPFFFYCLHYLYNAAYSRKQALITIIIASCFWQLFHSYTSLNSFIRIGFMPTLLILAFTVYKISEKKNAWLNIAIIAFNFIVQMHLFQQFITPLYMD